MKKHRMLVQALFAAAALLSGIGALSSAALAADVTAMDVRMFAPIAGGAPNTAMFLTLNNSGSDDYEVIRAESDVAQAVELHTHVEENGVMKMRPVPSIRIPSHGHVELKPGGLHVMFIGLKKPLKTGSRVRVRLILDHGGSVTVMSPVVARPGMEQGAPEHGRHGHGANH